MSWCTFNRAKKQAKNEAQCLDDHMLTPGEQIGDTFIARVVFGTACVGCAALTGLIGGHRAPAVPIFGSIGLVTGFRQGDRIPERVH